MNKPPLSEQMQKIGKALGRVPSGVYILTAEHDGTSTAMLASWVQQAAFEPPAVSVALVPQRPIVELIRGSKRFAISVIAEADKSLMKRYARGVKDGEDPFEGVATQRTPGGLPILADALAWLECELVSTCEFGGDHVLFVGRVTAGATLRDGAAFAHQRGSGFHY